MDLGNTLQNFAVLQRNDKNISEHPFAGSAQACGEVLLTVKDAGNLIVNGLNKIEVGVAKKGRVSGVIKGLPTGGPYTLTLQIAGSCEKNIFKNILVGDLWLLTGQSNMADSGALPSLSESSDMVHAYYMLDQWHIAKDPLHDTNRAVAPVHGGDPQNMPKTACGRGAGPGLPFGIAMYKATGVPQGLIACAHGGTSLQQWDPALKKQGGRSLYGAMYERLQALGGKVAGVLWYQGCSDTKNEETCEQYFERTRNVFRAMRRDCKNSDLPIVFAQLAAYTANPEDVVMSHKRWLHIRDAQYRLALQMKNTSCVPTIDLELCDHIHLSNRGVLELGKRMANAMLALREPEKYPGQITVKSSRCITDKANSYARVELVFDNVCGALESGNSNPCGFALAKNGEYISDAINCRLDGDRASVLLKVPAVFFDENYQITYGGSLQPHGNIKDSAGRSLPCFMLNGKKRPANLTEFVTQALVSEVCFGSEELSELNLPEVEVWKNMKFAPAPLGNTYMRCPSAWDKSDAQAARKYFFRYQIELTEAMELKVLFGSDAPFALYCDRQELLRKSTANPLKDDEFSCQIKLSAGIHEFAVAFAANGNRGWGICCRFLRTDGKNAPKLLPISEYK